MPDTLEFSGRHDLRNHLIFFPHVPSEVQGSPGEDTLNILASIIWL